MSRILHNIEVPIHEDLEEKLAYLVPNYGEYRILRKSVDARRRHSPHFVYSVEVAEQNETLTLPVFNIEKISTKLSPPVIVIGTGPAGLFAALRLVERGIPCLLFERGSSAEKRIVGINKFWRYGHLDPRNNVCFGEGGAGLYSDGKLITRIKSPHIPYVMDRLVKFGAPAEIRYLSNPHVGSDRIRRVIPALRKYLVENGCQIYFDTQVTEILMKNKNVIGIKTEHGQTFSAENVVVATGHSASDMLEHLHTIGVELEAKPFAMGLRIEHPQKLINKIQYREFADDPKLGSANYKLAHHDHKEEVGVYSFCMCPGGYVLSSGTEVDGLVCNGMSNYNRNGQFANAAIVVSINKNLFFKKSPLDGLEFRSNLEKLARTKVQASGGHKQLPAQRVVDFMHGKNSAETLLGSSPSGTANLRLDLLLPSFMTNKIREGLQIFDKSMKGFISEHAILYGVESRTSCPVRVPRSEDNLMSLSHQGLYPCGEGAGYAGGITSAACDGIRVAESIAQKLSSQSLLV